MLFKFSLFLVFAAVIAACGGPSSPSSDSGVADIVSPIQELSPQEAETAVAKAYSQFVDVRTADEYASGHAARALNIPLDELGSSLGRLEKNEPVYLICETGNRSRKAATLLKDAGYNNVITIKGGTQAWSSAGLPVEKKPPHVPPAR